MKGPSLQRSAVLSATLHVTVLMVSIVMFRQANHIVMPSPYVVSLVTPSKKFTRTATRPVVAPKKTPITKIKRPILSKGTYEVKQLKRIITDQKRVDDRISELEAKKRVERIVNLRSVISLKATGDEKKGSPEDQQGPTGPSKGTLMDNYYVKISGEIWQEWIYPDFGEKELEAVIFVKIQRDGAIIVQGVEKSSGNNLFDRSTLKALAKASPVSPPPYEMEIGIRFYP